MLKQTCPASEVQRCFLAADAMKTVGFDPATFRDRLAAERRRLAGLSDARVAEDVHNGDRRSRYAEGTWRRAVVQLSDCSVWEHMGGRRWASGLVPRVAQRLLDRNDPSDPIHSIVPNVQFPFAELPLIVFERKSNPAQYRIDDGCHRAVAYYLAGFRQAFAYVGRYGGKHPIEWPWEGLL